MTSISDPIGDLFRKPPIPPYESSDKVSTAGTGTGGGRPMSFAFGLDGERACFKRKFQWLLVIENVSADENSPTCLPPSKSARPNVSFKEIQAEHVNETIFMPGKPEWKPINLTLYDINRKGSGENPVFLWLRRIYNSCSREFTHETYFPFMHNRFKQNATLKLFDGCGNIIESWTYENAWPQQIEWGDLDMSSNDICMVDLTLRYDRAWINDFCVKTG